MDIKIPHSWLKDHLDTKASPQKIGEMLALCGPSVERITKDGSDFIYDIEVTTNRVDSASVRGIAREAATILPQFEIDARLKSFAPKLPTIKNSKLNVTVTPNPKLNKRVMAVVIDNVSAETKSPNWMRERLEKSGMRSLNLLVDITNYVMLEVGHPTHVFDYDKIPSHTLSFRLSKKSEKVTTFDGKTYSLPGNDIVIASDSGEIIDLPGIIGTKNSVVDSSTKRIIFFLDNNDPGLMRKTSLALGIRTAAVQLNEKDINPQLAPVAFARGIELYTSLAKGKVVSKIYDFYPKKDKPKLIRVTLAFITARIGVDIKPTRITQILTSLGFATTFYTKKNEFSITVPSFRAGDVDIAEDIVEEVARIFGYHNLPSVLMAGPIPTDHDTAIYDFELLVKEYLRGWGALEIYCTSLVSKAEAGANALRLRNPLGVDTEYLRTTLYHTMMRSITQNSGITKPLHLFEMANIYLPRKEDLPVEQMMLSGCLLNYPYRQAKGMVEALLDVLHINYSFAADQNTVLIKSGNEVIGKLKVINDNTLYYEFEVATLQKHYRRFLPYKSTPKYPAQIEDVTFTFSKNVHVGEVIAKVKEIDNIVVNVELKDIFKDNYTFQIWYQHPNKTLTNKEVEKVRTKIINTVNKKWSGVVKS